MWILHKLLAKQADEVKVIVIFDDVLVGADSFDDLAETLVAGSSSSQEIQMFLATPGVSREPITLTRIFSVEQIPPSLDVLFDIHAVVFDIIVLLFLIEAVFEIFVFFVQVFLEFLLIRLGISN